MTVNTIRGLFLLLTFSFVSHSFAATNIYHSQADFLSAASGMDILKEDFDSFAAPVIVPNGADFGDFTLNYATSGFDVMIDNVYDTTSPTNYLGTTDGGAFFGGDSLTFTFDQAQQGFALYITAGFEIIIYDDDFTLTTNSGVTAGNSAVPDAGVTLSDGDAYFLGFIETDPNLSFNQITLSSVSDDYYYNVDDVIAVVPELETYIMMAGGIPLMLWWQRRQRSTQSNTVAA